MKKAKAAVMALVFVMVMAVPNVAFANQSVTIAQEEIMLIPVRDYFETLGGIVTWNSSTRSVNVSWGGSVIIILLDAQKATVDGYELALGHGLVRVGGTIFIHENDLLLIREALPFRGTMTFILTEEARDIVLYDFDYMIKAILENSPWDSVVYRALGIDFDAFVESFRNEIEAMDPFSIRIHDNDFFAEIFPIQQGDDARSLAANYLFALLAFDFSHQLMGIGHLGPEFLNSYIMLFTNFSRHYSRWGSSPMLDILMRSYNHPSAIWFYGEVEVDLADTVHVAPIISDNVTTEILIPDEVAYIHIGSFMSNPDYDDVVILPFLQEIHDFDHLIIDIRGNRGGFASYFDDLILSRLISEPVEVTRHEFFTGGDMAREMMDIVLESSRFWYDYLYVDILPAGTFIENQGMSLFDQQDLARLDYVMVSRTGVWPTDDSINFDGKVWLLVDEESASASAMITEMALYTGFATVVGENTSGVMGVENIFITLPNTGIIWRIDIGYRTDNLGRSLEVYGIAPQVYNQAGMDALETVLWMIEQGDW